MSERKKVLCPSCGAEMNFHAEKVDYSRGTPDRDNENPELGGVLVEFHTCPICRFVLERPAG